MEVYLIIDNYFNRKYERNTKRLLENWMELMPISYGVIDLSNFSQKCLFGVELEAIANSSVYL